jgi:hypothetical protein
VLTETVQLSWVLGVWDTPAVLPMPPQTHLHVATLQLLAPPSSSMHAEIACIVPKPAIAAVVAAWSPS